ncbi:MAG TPA: NfeD family protein [Candidatus Limnocylindrales bacterium]|nr:NfeD family protein [Candidatus Limnocylindrales bacterium]
MITVDLANTIFILCLAIGGILLLLTILLEDLLGGIFESIGLGFDLGGVTLMPLLLAFVSMFGVGGLLGTQLLGMSAGMASLVGLVFGLIGAGLVWGMFTLLRRAEAPPQFSLNELVGERGRVSVAIPAGRAGSVLISYGGSTHDITATADGPINQGTLVTVTDVAGTTLVVRAATVAGEEGSSDA